MSPDWIPVAISIVGPLIIAWGGYKLFIGRITEWRSFMDEKHAETVRRLERHIDKDESAHETIAILKRDAEQLAKFVQELRDYKHLKIDPYIGTLDAMSKRVERIERYLNGNLK